MAPALKTFLQRWFVNTLAVLAAAHLVKGISYDSWGGLLAASLLLGILNAFLRPLLLLLSLPLLLVTFGLFILVINALLLYFIGWLLQSFHVSGFASAFWGALVISLVSMLVNSLVEPGTARQPARSHPTPAPEKGDGPVIDV